MAIRGGTLFLLVGVLGLCGCATRRLDLARESYYRGDYAQAVTNLAWIPSSPRDRVLFLMERGSMQQARHRYEDSIQDWLAAAELADELDYLSVSRSSASLVANDRLLAYRGYPFERTLIHAFNALNFFALQRWDDAAVEARNMIYRLETRNDFPDDPYSRYLAGFCLEMIGDYSGSDYQYSAAAGLLCALRVDSRTGRITRSDPAGNGLASSPPATEGESPGGELVCFISIGQSPGHGATGDAAWGTAPYAEIYDGDTCLGPCYLMADTGRLMADTQKRLATLRALKDVSRVVAKEAAAQVVSHENEALGELLRLFLFALEAPDTRYWGTLPRWLGVARVPCPTSLTSYRVVVKDSSGRILKQEIVTQPLSRRRDTFVSFCRLL